MRYRIKQKANTNESQACCEEKQETSVHANDNKWFLYIWLGTFEVQIVENIIARLHGLLKIKRDIHL